MSTTLKTLLTEKSKAANAQLKYVNDLLRKKSTSKDDYDKAINDLKDKVADENVANLAVEYEALSKEKSPLVAAVKKYSITQKTVKEVSDKDSNTILEVKFGEKVVKIDLDHFCIKMDYDREWSRECSQLLALLTLKKLKDYDITKLSPAELAKKSNAFIKYAFEKQRGFTPDSNTKVVKLIQSIIDKVLGEGVYKATNYDINFIYDCVTKMDSKGKCAIAMVNDRAFHSVMFEVFAHALGESYKVTGSRIKYDDEGASISSIYNQDQQEKHPENKPADEPKPEEKVAESMKKAAANSKKKSA